MAVVAEMASIQAVNRVFPNVRIMGIDPLFQDDRLLGVVIRIVSNPIRFKIDWWGVFQRFQTFFRKMKKCIEMCALVEHNDSNG